MDPSYYLQDDEDADPESFGCCTVTVFAKKIDDLPTVRNIGDIIRIHRASWSNYKGLKQFNVNVYYNSSWCLFHTDLGSETKAKSNSVKKEEPAHSDDELTASKKKEIMPYLFSGKSFSADAEIHAHLQELREWAKKYFKDYNVITPSMYTLLSNCENMDKNDFDLLCKIVKILDKDDYTNWIKLKDTSGEVWTTNIDKARFPHVQQGEIVRIRSAGVKDGDKKELELRFHSNIMRFINGSKLVERLLQEISNDETGTNSFDTSEEFAKNPVLITDVSPSFSSEKITQFASLFHSDVSEDQDMEVDKAEQKPEENSKIQENDNSHSEHEESKSSKSKGSSKKSKQKSEVKSKIKNDPEVKSELPPGKDYRVRFYTLGYEPKDLREAVRAVCTKWYADFSLKDTKSPKKGKSAISCQKWEADWELNYKIKLLTKDTSTSKNPYLYSVLLFSRPGQGDGFFKDMKPSNLYTDEDGLEYIKKYMELLTKFNIYVDGVVRNVNNNFLLHDTSINIDIKE